MPPAFPARFSFLTPKGPLVGLLGLVGLTAQAQAQAPPWQTAVASLGHFCTVKATAIGPGGEVYLVGSFAGTPRFGQLVLPSTENDQGLDAFVAKWSPAAQQFVWAKRIGGIAWDEARAVAVQGGAVYVTGSFASPHLRAGSLTLTNADTVAQEHRLGKKTTDMFVVKLTDAGRTAAFTWAQRAGGVQDDTGQGVAVQGTQVYVMGTYSSPESLFGPYSLPAPADGLPEDAGAAAQQFVAKLTDAGARGHFEWVVPTSGRQQAGALAVNVPDVYVVSSPASDDGSDGDGWGGSGDVPTDGPSVTKLTDAGASARRVWMQRLARGSTVSAVAVSGASVYLAGSFGPDTLRLGPLVLRPPASGREKLATQTNFVAKLADAGARADYVWAQPVGGPDACSSGSLAVTGDRLYVTGSFWGGTAALASKSPVPLTLYVARLTDLGATGHADWVSAVGPPRTYVPPREKPRNFRQRTTHSEVNAVAARGSRVYIAGGFNGQLQFGTRVLAFAVRTNLAAFLASFTDSGR